MSDDSKPSSRWPLLSATLQGLVMVATTLAGYLAGPSQVLQIPAKPATAVAGALTGIVGVWAAWSYRLWKRDSKRERIKDAIAKGRIICHCTESGEILKYHSGAAGSLSVYACPECGSYHVAGPPGDTLLSEDTEFIPPLPDAVRNKWLENSKRRRGEE